MKYILTKGTMMATKADPARIGKDWDDLRRYELLDLIREAGRTGAKRSIRRIAKDAGVSEQFIRSLLPIKRDHETSKVTAVLRALGTTPEEFAQQVNGTLF